MKKNKRILLASGSKKFDDKIKELVEAYESDEFIVVGTAQYKYVLLDKVEETRPDIVYIVESLDGSEDIFKIVESIRTFTKVEGYEPPRVIFDLGMTKMTDEKVTDLIGLAVYDFLENGNINQVFDAILNPNGISAILEYLPKNPSFKNLKLDSEQDLEKKIVKDGVVVNSESKQVNIEANNKIRKELNFTIPRVKINFGKEEIPKTPEEIEADEKLKEANKKLREQQRQERIAKKNADAEEKAKLAEEKRIQREKDAEERERQRKYDEENRRIQAEKDAEEKRRKDKELAEKLERDKELARLELEKAEEDAKKAKEEEDSRHKREKVALKAKELKRKAKRERQSVRRIKWRRRKKFVYSILTAILIMALIYYVQVYTGKEASELIGIVFDFAKSFVVEGFEKIKPILEGILNKAQETLN